MNKKSIIFRSILAIGLLGVTFSCSENTDPLPVETDLTVVDDDVAVNQVYEDLDNFTLTVFQSLNFGGRVLNEGFDKICPGVDVTFNEEEKKITVDFGEGCTSPGGTVRKGKIVFTYNQNFLFPGAKVIAVFESYEVDGLAVQGTRTIENQNIDIFNNRVTLKVTVTDGKVTWPDGTFVTYTTTQERVVTLNEQNGYEISITGNASGKSRAGLDYTTTVTSPLLVTQDCVETGVLVPSSGVMEFNYSGFNVSVDYGDGQCDKNIIITYPGGTREVTLD